jgi:hypothetical protein
VNEVFSIQIFNLRGVEMIKVGLSDKKALVVYLWPDKNYDAAIIGYAPEDWDHLSAAAQDMLIIALLEEEGLYDKYKLDRVECVPVMIGGLFDVMIPKHQMNWPRDYPLSFAYEGVLYDPRTFKKLSILVQSLKFEQRFGTTSLAMFQRYGHRFEHVAKRDSDEFENALAGIPVKDFFNGGPLCGMVLDTLEGKWCRYRSDCQDYNNVMNRNG